MSDDENKDVSVLEEEEEQLASAYPIVPLLLLFLSLLLSWLEGEYNLTSDAPRRDHPMVANMLCIAFVSCDDFFEISRGVDE